MSCFIRKPQLSDLTINPLAPELNDQCEMQETRILIMVFNFLCIPLSSSSYLMKQNLSIYLQND